MFCDPPVAEGLGMRSGVQFRGWLRQPTTPEVARSGENGALLLSIGCGEVRFYTILPEVLGLVTLRCTAIAPHHARRPEKVVFVGDVREGHPAVAFPERHREKLYARSILMMQVARMREVVAVTSHSWHIRGTFEAHSWRCGCYHPWSNNMDTDSPLWILRMASASTRDTSITTSLSPNISE